MPSPFPGMNPYVEQPAVWQDFHTRFMTTAAEVRVLPESLPSSWKKLRAGWPRAARPAAP